LLDFDGLMAAAGVRGHIDVLKVCRMHFLWAARDAQAWGAIPDNTHSVLLPSCGIVACWLSAVPAWQIDVEGHEWAPLLQIFKDIAEGRLSVGQLQVELHTVEEVCTAVPTRAWDPISMIAPLPTPTDCCNTQAILHSTTLGQCWAPSEVAMIVQPCMQGPLSCIVLTGREALHQPRRPAQRYGWRAAAVRRGGRGRHATILQGGCPLMRAI
jgi:hypothetical protein